MFSIIQGDLEPDMEITVTANDEGDSLVASDTIEMRWKKPDGTVSIVPLVPVDLPAGVVKKVWVDGDTDLVGTHYGQIRVTHSAPNSGLISATVNASAGTYTRSTGSYLSDGFGPGMEVTWSGYVDAGNNVTKIVSVVSALVMTVTDATGLVSEAGTGDERVVSDAAEPQTFPSDGSHVIWNVYSVLS